MTRVAEIKDQSDIGRARYMLKVAALYIRDHFTEGEIFYDEAVCDGNCVADDCFTAAEALDKSCWNAAYLGGEAVPEAQ
jgi:hypothetical protein